MTKYILEIITRLTNFKNGQVKNADKWTKPDETPEAVQAVIDSLNNASKGIDDAKENLTLAQVNARNLESEATKKADELENLAIAYEKSDPVKLSLYGIELRKQKERKPAPTSTLHPKLQDDTDGVGFILTTNVESVADQYEWQKGTGADATKIDVIPEMKLFKTTTKTSFVDDDVNKGVRYFYRVRAINAAGEGPWSEAVSRVQ
jgi:hypothetical protein